MIWAWNSKIYYNSFLLGLFILSASYGCGNNSVISNENKIKSAVENIAKNRNIPSLGLAISTKGKSYQFSYHNPDVLQQKIYGIGSTTKLLSAVLVMHYVEQKELDINNKIVQYIDKSDIDHIVGIENVQCFNCYGMRVGFLTMPIILFGLSV